MAPTHPSMLGAVAVNNLLDGGHGIVDADDRAEASACSGCGQQLPPHAVYCIECGRCELSQTDEGTRVVRSPYTPRPPSPEPIPPPPEYGSGPIVTSSTAEEPEPLIPYAEDHATIPVAALETNPDLSLGSSDFEAQATAPREPAVDTRAVTRAVEGPAPSRHRATPLPVPPKRARPPGSYLIAPKATRTMDTVAGVVETGTPEPNVRTLSRCAPRWAPAGITRLDRDERKDTLVTRAPAAPSPYWDAPPKGNTVKRRAPES